MNFVDKIKKSWWVIFSFIPFLNGFGLIYTALTHYNKNWLIEGIMYEIPWFFFIIYAVLFGDLKGIITPVNIITVVALMLELICIIRSLWVAIKLSDVYDNNEKYTIKPTKLSNQKSDKRNHGIINKIACCFCLIAIFIVFALVAKI